MTTMTMTRNTFETKVDIRGDGTPVLFISGAGDDYRAWDGVREGLHGYLTIAFDNRDVGEGPRGPERYTVADMARDAIEVLNAQGIVRAHVVGHSLGSFIAQEVALQAPHRVESLTLVGSMAKPDEYLMSLARLWETWSIDLSTEDFARSGIFFWLGPEIINEAGLENLVAEFTPYLEAQGTGAFIRQIEAAMTHDTLSRLGEIAAPTLVLVGEQDICTLPQFSRVLAAGIPDARMVTMSRVGHSPTVEAPDELRAIIAEFWASL